VEGAGDGKAELGRKGRGKKRRVDHEKTRKNAKKAKEKRVTNGHE
jgi:hypothetical protein